LESGAELTRGIGKSEKKKKKKHFMIISEEKVSPRSSTTKHLGYLGRRVLEPIHSTIESSWQTNGQKGKENFFRRQGKLEAFRSLKVERVSSRTEKLFVT